MNIREWVVKLFRRDGDDGGVRLTSVYEKRREEENLRMLKARANALRQRARLQQDGKEG